MTKTNKARRVFDRMKRLVRLFVYSFAIRKLNSLAAENKRIIDAGGISGEKERNLMKEHNIYTTAAGWLRDEA